MFAYLFYLRKDSEEDFCSGQLSCNRIFSSRHVTSDVLTTFSGGFLPGGEDCAVRIWSLTSGRLLHAEKILSSPAACICWPISMRK
jgi:hypothetical protein